VSDTATRHIKLTFSDDCHGAVRFPSGGTGAMIDGDPGFYWGDWDLTSDRVGNKVDSSSFFEDPSARRAFVVVDFEWLPKLEAAMFKESIGGGFGSVFMPLPTGPSHPSAPTPVVTQDSSAITSVPEGLTRPLAEELTEIRESLDMPVSDLARMIGLGRRQFYNLLSGAQTVPATESRIRRIAEAIRGLHRELDGDPELVRAAVLTPVGDNSLSFFESASLGDEALLRESLDAMRRRVAGRGIRRTRRAIPRAASSGQRELRHRHIREEIGELPSVRLDPDPQGEQGGPD
jgi:transcriptional regulator with XRE-family HTH domain